MKAMRIDSEKTDYDSDTEDERTKDESHHVRKYDLLRVFRSLINLCAFGNLERFHKMTAIMTGITSS